MITIVEHGYSQSCQAEHQEATMLGCVQHVLRDKVQDMRLHA
jgi:hypothetical protein